MQFREGLARRRALRQALSDLPPTPRAVDLDPARLLERNIRAIALDFDGVLAPHGRTTPTPEAEAWIDRCVDAFGPGRVHLLSNNPAPRRAEHFARRFPHVRFLAGVRPKPHPDGILAAAEASGVPPRAVAIVDDRILTGVLAAVLAGARAIYVTKPYVDLPGNPAKESFFIAVRALERALFPKG